MASRREKDETDGPRRPGPHGAFARTSAEEEAIRQAYARAKKGGRRGFQEISPKPVTAAEAVSSLTEEGYRRQGRKKLWKSSACFVATAAYGRTDCVEVERLRRFRDRHLLTNPVGTAFVRAYYRISPPIARAIARRPALRRVVRRTLDTLFRNAAL
ncbi:MAG: hypothetical protein O7E54_10150 [Planctomycetota bacterium]|nr:hypothetical protein [Planctomycetota bacterium]